MLLCRRRKAYIRVQFRDPQLRKLHYHIAEVQRMQALIRLKESVKEERLSLIEEGGSTFVLPAVGGATGGTGRQSCIITVTWLGLS